MKAPKKSASLKREPTFFFFSAAAPKLWNILPLHVRPRRANFLTPGPHRVLKFIRKAGPG